MIVHIGEQLRKWEEHFTMILKHIISGEIPPFVFVRNVWIRILKTEAKLYRLSMDLTVSPRICFI